MSVLIETSAGDIVIDLHTAQAPNTCKNFLKLCKVKYYNFSPVYNVQKDFSFQTGDPIGPGHKESDGGTSIWGVISGPQKRYFPAEFHQKLKHGDKGTVSMATAPSEDGSDTKVCASQFIVTLGSDLEYLDGRSSVFGQVVEGFDTLEKINGSFCDDKGRPLQDIRIKHTIVLDDPFDNPDGLVEPPESPAPSKAQLETVRIGENEDLNNEEDEETAERRRRERDAQAQALTLEMVGDLPFADVKPPENILFVCKLNPVTQDEDLELIFSRFGKILSCEVIREKRTGDSLQYAFIEFDEQKDCEQAYFKMDGVLIDDHRIHVDFSQSVSKLSDSWRTDTNAKRKMNAGAGGGRGFGGSSKLAKRSQYREDDRRANRDSKPSSYGMVFDVEGGGGDRRGGSNQQGHDRRDRRDDDRRDPTRGGDHERDRHRNDGDRRKEPPRRDRDGSRERDRDHRRDFKGQDSRRYRSRSRSPKHRSSHGRRDHDRDRERDRDRDRPSHRR